MKLKLQSWPSIITLAISLAATASVSVNAAPGDPDTTFAGVGKFAFGFGGSLDAAHALAVQADGKILVAGRTVAGSEYVFAVARYHPDGSGDTSFGPNGIVLTNIPEESPAESDYDEAFAITVQTDGKIVVVGITEQQSGQNDFAVVRYHPDGSLDTSFDGDGIALVNFDGFDLGHAVRVQSDGKIVVAGYKDFNFALARLNPDGTLDTTFDGDGKVTTSIGPGNAGTKAGLVIQGDGRIVMAGSLTGVQGFIVVRYLADGSLDTSFDIDGKVITSIGSSAKATAVALQPASNSFFPDRIVVSGSTFNGSKEVLAVARYLADGSLDTSFDTDGTLMTDIPGTTRANGLGLAVEGAFKAPGRIVVAGWATRNSSSGPVTEFALVRYTSSGSLDTTFDTDGIAITPFRGSDEGTAVALLAGAKLLVCGASAGDAALARYNADGSLDTTFNGDGKKVDEFSGRPASAQGVAMQADGRIIVAGSAVGTASGLAIARFNPDGTFDETFGAEGKIVEQTVKQEGNAVVLQGDGKIVVAGVTGDTTSDFALNRFHPDGSRDASFGSNGFATVEVTTSADFARAAALQADGKILAAGSGQAGTGNNDVALVRVNPDGSRDSTFDLDGQILIGLSTENDEAHGVAVQPDGRILVAGNSGNDGASRFFVARFNTDGRPDHSFGENGVVFTSIGAGHAKGSALALLPSGHIVLAGSAFNGTNFDFALARYHQDGTLDSSLGGTGVVLTPLSEGNDEATALAVQADGKMILAGGITHVDLGTTDPNMPIRTGHYAVVRYNFDGSLDPSYGTAGKTIIAYDPDGDDRATGVAVDASNRAVVVGRAGGLFGVARIEGGPLVPTVLANISTRLRVLNGDNALIGGMIATGTTGKRVIIRAIGPTLTDFGLPGTLQDPTLELFQGDAPVASNDDWRNSPQQAEIANSGLAPNKDAESAIIATLTPNQNYTAVVRGANNGTGIGVVEAYDLDRSVDSQLANISTRGLVQTGDNVLIAGTIVRGPSTRKVIVRAIGPSLPIAGALADPTLELRNANGDVIRSNDNWRTGGQETEIIQSGVPPANDSESALVETLSGNGATYTAIVRGAGNATGVAVVEVYALN